MFKQKYIEYLKDVMSDFVPDGYTLKIVEEVGFGANTKPNEKFTIYVYVKFGVGNKQTNANNIINQPITLSAKSEAGDFRVATEILEKFFLTYSKTINTIVDGENTYTVWNDYNTPNVISTIENIGIAQRVTVMMFGRISYSLNLLIGAKYSLSLDNTNFTQYTLIQPQRIYNTQATTPQKINSNYGSTELDGSNIVFSFSLMLDTSAICLKLLDMSFNGGSEILYVKTEYSPTIIYNGTYRVTQVSNIHDNQTYDNLLNITLMKV